MACALRIAEGFAEAVRTVVAFEPGGPALGLDQDVDAAHGQCPSFPRGEHRGRLFIAGAVDFQIGL
jgi:hypothetical protein